MIAASLALRGHPAHTLFGDGLPISHVLCRFLAALCFRLLLLLIYSINLGLGLCVFGLARSWRYWLAVLTANLTVLLRSRLGHRLD